MTRDWTNSIQLSARPISTRGSLLILFFMMIVLLPVKSVLAASPWIQQANWPWPSDSGVAAIGDLNGDGKLDLLFGQTDGTFTAYHNTGTNASPVWVAEAPGSSWLNLNVPCNRVLNSGLTDSGGYFKPGLADLDGDGDLDLVLGTRAFVCIYENTGGPTSPVWTRNTAWESGLEGLRTNNMWFPQAFADLDGDGKLDFLLSDGYERIVFRNTGMGSAPNIVPAWTEMDSWANKYPSAYVGGWALGDLDGDGRIDWLETSVYNGYIYVYPNIGTPTSPSYVSPATNWSIFAPTVSNAYKIRTFDLNGDGKLDLIVPTTAGAQIYYQSSAGMGTPDMPSTPVAPTAEVTDHFDSFSCPGAWELVSGTYYKRDCGNGWTAFAGGIDPGNTDIVTSDSVNGPSSSSAPDSSVYMYTAPTPDIRNSIWLLKTFDVEPGVRVDHVTMDARFKTYAPGQPSYRDNYGLQVFDGAITNPNTATILAQDVRLDGAYGNSGPSDACYLHSTGTWCDWEPLQVGGFYPAHSKITVGLYLTDGGVYQYDYAQFDNLVLSDIVQAASPTTVNDIAQLWSASILAGGTDNMASASDIVSDVNGNTGNIYVTGSSYNGSNYDIVTAKYDSTGALVAPWPVTYDGGSGDQAVAMAMDNAGGIDVIGKTYNGTDNDYLVLKYDKVTGALLWSAAYPSTPSGRDEVPIALTVDAGGNVYVTGNSCNASQIDCNYLTVKFNVADGSVAWYQPYDGGGEDKAIGIKLDGSDNVYVTGYSTGATDDVVTIKYDSSGTKLWESRYDSGVNERPAALAVDSAGNSFIAVNTYNGNSTIRVLKYGPSGGDPVWIGKYGYGTNDAMASAIALDSAGNIYVTGKTGAVNNYDVVTLKFLDADGSMAWVQTYGNPNFNDWGVDVAVDNHDNIYVLGTLTRSVGNTDFVTLKYNSSGVEQNAITYDGSSLGDVPASLALGVDADGDTTAYVVGTSSSSVDNNAYSGLDHIEVVGYQKSQPDLAVSNLTGPTSATVGDTISVANTVTNFSDLANKVYADSVPSTVAFYLAPDLGGSADLNQLTSLGTRDVSSLKPGEFSSENTSLTIPNSLAEGGYFLVATADSTGAVTEADETNNTLVSTSSLAIQGLLPDLTVTNVSGPTSAAHGDPFNVTVTIANLYSTAVADSFRVGIYASTSQNITTSDTLIGSYTVAGLAGNSSNTTTTSVTIPDSGTYYIAAIVDDQNAITNEFDENNNTTLMASGVTSSTLLAGRSNFIDGMPDKNVGAGTNNVGVTMTLGAANVRLAHSPSWTRIADWDAPTVGGHSNLSLGDLNGDGLPDLIAGDYVGNLYAYMNTGSASLPVWSAAPSSWTTLSVDCSAGGYSGYKAPKLIDLNGDGLNDLVIGTRGGVCMYENTGTAGSPTWTRNTNWESGLGSLDTNSFYSPALADLDGDGKVDMMLGWSGSTSVLSYRNTGTTKTPAWTAEPSWNASVGFTQSIPALADLDGDGKYDMLVGNTGGTIKAFQNTGTVFSPAWTAKTEWDNSTPQTYTVPAFADLNGDGSYDMLIGTISGGLLAYQNTGTFLSSGTYVSKVLDAGTHGGFTTLSYTGVVPLNTTLSVDVRAGDDIVGLVTADPGTGADGSFDSSTYDGSSIPGITGTSPSLTINTDNAPVTIASGDATYPLGAGIFNFTDFTLATGDTITVTGSKALIIRTNNGDVTIAGTLNASAGASGAAGPGAYSGGLGAAAGNGPGGGQHYSSYGEGSGGGYGGAGGAANLISGGVVYGTDDLAVFYGGSGGGGCLATNVSTGTQSGGGGGGAVKIETSADIIVSGAINASGSAGVHCFSSNGNTNAESGSGGGAGGAVYLSGNNVSINGTLSANGAAGGAASGGSSGGGGGGGRVYLRGASSVSVTGTATDSGGAAGASSNRPGSPGNAGTYLVPSVPLVFNSPPGGTWTDWLNDRSNGGDISSLGTKRYVQYRFRFTTTDPNVSPSVYNVQAHVDEPPPVAVPISILSGSSSGGGGGELSAMDLLVLGLFLLYVHGLSRGRSKSI